MELSDNNPIVWEWLTDMNAIAFLNYWAINVDKGKIAKEKADKLRREMKTR